MKFSGVIILYAQGEIKEDPQSQSMFVYNGPVKVMPIVTLIDNSNGGPLPEEEREQLTKMVGKQLIMWAAEHYRVEGMQAQERVPVDLNLPPGEKN
jgi:hypothetical protein